MECVWTIPLMVTNGIFFFPPSEYLYFEGYWCHKGISSLYFTLPIANSIGHFILFIYVRYINISSLLHKNNNSNDGFIYKLIIQLNSYSKTYFSSYDTKYLAVIYGRCIPFVHTAISIAAGLSNMNITKFIIYTLLGNYIFSLICYMILSNIVSKYSYTYSLLIVLVIILVAPIIHIMYTNTRNNNKE